ncbi:MAG: 4-hydroxy-3-methylbut-2-en-yl diphosphate reductase [Candidatus Atribacteria bacterium]|nr:4-hydroxy-3-methylbut-2-en-yl diphosphate reductase [Candidatus Atribacteria bacterium]
MKVVKAKSIGFCPGVQRAFNLTFETLNQSGTSPVYLLGELVHNRQAVEELQTRGARLIHAVSEIKGDSWVISRSHGLEKETLVALEEKGVRLVNTTCPRVKKVQLLAQKLNQDNFSLVILGNLFHPEIKALLSYIDGKALVLGGKEEEWERSLSHPAWKGRPAIIEQTTFPIRSFLQFKNWLRNKGLEEKTKLFSTLCLETGNRQQELREKIQKEGIERVIVIGGKQSSNTRALFLVAKEEGIPTIWIEKADELDLSLVNQGLVLVTSGTSTPNWIVEEVVKRLEKFSQGEKIES